MRTFLTRVIREWPLLLAAGAMVSLYFVPRFARPERLAREREARELAELRRRVETGDLDGTEDRLRGFLARHPDGPHVSEASYLLGRSVVQRARSGAFTGAPALSRAWHDLTQARLQGYDSARTDELQREIALMLSERDLSREAIERYTELYRQTGDPELLLDLARTLGHRAAREPALRQSMLDEAAGRVSEYLRSVPPERRIRGFLTQARISWDVGRYAEMLPVLERELAEARSPSERSLLQLERGKALARLADPSRALAVLEEAEELTDDSRTRALAQLFQAELFARSGSPATPEACARLIAGNSSYGPLAYLVLGVYELESDLGEPLDNLKTGLTEARRPMIFEEAGFDVPWFYGALSRAWEEEIEPDRLIRFAGLLREMERLFPRVSGYTIDHARLLLRAGRPGEAADRFLAAASSGALEPADREKALLSAAEASDQGGLHARAAALYRRFYEANPDTNSSALFREGLSLRRAGRLAEALQVLSDYLARAGSSSPLVASAVLTRGEMLAELGHREEAIAEFDRILRARDLVTDPRQEEWAQALLGRGRTLLDLGRLRDGKQSLQEYLERYSLGTSVRSGAVEAAFLLVRAAVREGRWQEGLSRVTDLKQLEARIPGSEREAYEDLLREARFLEGDLHYNDGRYEEAVRAYGDAYRRYITSHDRLWGLLGRARALARLERKEEARRDYANARALFEEARGAYEKSMAGRGREYWTIALDAAARDVQ